VGKFPEFAPMLEEAHSEFVSNHVGNIERLSGNSEKASQWLLERRARDEFSAPYTQGNAPQGSVNVLALGNDALSKLMQGWSGMMEGKAEQAQVIDVSEDVSRIPNTQAPSTLLVDNSMQCRTPPEPENLPQVSEEVLPQQEEQPPKIEEVKAKRGRGRPRKYPKPDASSHPPPQPLPII